MTVDAGFIVVAASILPGIQLIAVIGVRLRPSVSLHFILTGENFDRLQQAEALN
jgi:hypothetical protein